MMLQADISAQDRVIQILLEKDSKGNDQPMIIDSKGKKDKLSLGTLLNATAEAWMEGTKTPAYKEDPKAIAQIQLNKSGKNIQAILFDSQNREEPLTLGALLGAAAQTYPGCTPDQINGQTVNLQLTFEADSDGNIQAFLMTANGKEKFNLGVMIRETTLLLNQCKNPKK